MFHIHLHLNSSPLLALLLLVNTKTPGLSPFDLRDTERGWLLSELGVIDFPRLVDFLALRDVEEVTELNQSICAKGFNDRTGVVVSRELREALPFSNAPTPIQGRSGTTHVGDDMTEGFRACGLLTKLNFDDSMHVTKCIADGILLAVKNERVKDRIESLAECSQYRIRRVGLNYSLAVWPGTRGMTMTLAKGFGEDKFRARCRITVGRDEGQGCQEPTVLNLAQEYSPHIDQNLYFVVPKRRTAE
ncbi:hypothetical protein DFH08DRAFT_814666 [Mycena albidolilacea]|uniref:Uncharacterized protein n=1 Tax=Mycena albidolilacea TaxID=1033008 RepID=A0AAD6ZNY7_9AGAR|nr:hypothetical protein DFH08DRAFT_814666 [Mycena albidolilacea]